MGTPHKSIVTQYILEDCVKSRDGANGYELHIEHLAIARGDTIALTGESGCGKSTALDILGLVLEPTHCASFTFVTEEAAWDIPALFRAKRFDILARLRLLTIGYVLQTGELLPYLTVRENMLVPARMAGMPLALALEAAEEASEQLGIAHKMAAMPATLSVGERQRVAIARALVQKPRIILADEPTAALDPLHAAKVMEAFLSAVREQGATLLLVTHNVRWVRESSLTELRFRVEQTEKGPRAYVTDRGERCNKLS